MLRVAEICKEQGMTMVELAEKMGITYQALYATLGGNPSLKRLTKIAEILKVDITELFQKSKKTDCFRCPKCGARLQIVEK